MMFAVPIVLAIGTTDAKSSGWIGAGGRNAFEMGSPVSPDFGVELMGGGWFADEHLQPIFRVGWSHGASNAVAVDALRLGAGLGAGATFWDGRIWLGGTLELYGVHAWARWSFAREQGSSAALAASALFELRLAHRFLLGVQAGPEIDVPTHRFDAGTNDEVVWGLGRFNAGLRLGIILGG
jgi:hypothetical protein